MASKAFVEFSTSGLENALLHVELLLLVFFAQRALENRTGLPPVVLLGSLLLVTRIDQFWLVSPLVLGVVVSARRDLRLAHTWLAASPLVAWELFSIFYYGFPFPNTAYAKLDTGIPSGELMAQGVRYLGANLSYDPLTLGTIAVGVLLGLASRRLGPTLIGGGVLLWLGYLVRIGGDFMLGRLLTPALVLALVVVIEATPDASRRFVLGGATAALLVAPWLPRSALVGVPRQSHAGWLPERVTDERAIFYPLTGLFRTTTPQGPRSHQWVLDVLGAVQAGKRVVPSRSVGFVGYFVGPTVHVVDEFGLAEPLLARLPADSVWWPGHFQRALPPGYLATLESGHNQIEDPTLAAGYRDLARITRDPLPSPARLGTVFRWLLERPAIYPAGYSGRHATRDERRDALKDGARSAKAASCE
jgi:arabinofuranosyltransferase